MFIHLVNLKKKLVLDYIPDFNILSDISKKVDSNNQRLTAIDNTIKELSPWKSIKEPIVDLNSFEKSKFIMGYLPTKNLEKFKTSTVDLKFTYFDHDFIGRIMHTAEFIEYVSSLMSWKKKWLLKI